MFVWVCVCLCKRSQRFCLIEVDKMGAVLGLRCPLRDCPTAPSHKHCAGLAWNELACSLAFIASDRWKWYSGAIARQEIRLKGLSSVFLTHVLFRPKGWYYNHMERKMIFSRTSFILTVLSTLQHSPLNINLFRSKMSAFHELGKTACFQLCENAFKCFFVFFIPAQQFLRHNYDCKLFSWTD